MVFGAFSCFSGNSPDSLWLTLCFYLVRSHIIIYISKDINHKMVVIMGINRISYLPKKLPE